MFVLEALKMETPVNCAVEGVIEEFYVEQGEMVREGQPLARVREGGRE